MAAERNLQALAVQLQNLSYWLRYATDQFQSSPECDRRHAVGVAVKALSEFVGNVFSLEQDLRLPLNELLYGLDDLDRGQPGVLLKPAPVGHRARIPLSTSLFRADAAALMDFYQLAGMPRKNAAIHATIELNGLGYKGVRAKNLEDWRDELKARQGENDKAAQRYSWVLNHLKSQYPNEPEKAAQCLLDALRGMFAPKIPE